MTLTHLTSYGEIQAATFAVWTAQAPASDPSLVAAWMDIQTHVSAPPLRFSDIGELLYAHRSQLVPEARLLAWQIAQFMTFGPMGGAFRYGEAGRGAGMMAALVRDIEAEAHAPDPADPAVDERWRAAEAAPHPDLARLAPPPADVD